MTSGERDQRPAAAGELCTCRREALLVFLDGPAAPVGYCAFDDGGLPASWVGMSTRLGPGSTA